MGMAGQPGQLSPILDWGAPGKIHLESLLVLATKIRRSITTNTMVMYSGAYALYFAGSFSP
jgi:hypothetical protein